MHAPFLALAFMAAALCSCVHAGPSTPPDLLALECQFHQLAFSHFSKLVPSSPQSLHDALNLQNCTSLLGKDALAANRAVLDAPPPPRGELPRAGEATLYVATTGSDSTGARPGEFRRRRALPQEKSQQWQHREGGQGRVAAHRAARRGTRT